MIAALERIATALERIADAMSPEDDVSEPEIVADHPTLINPLLAWFASAQPAPVAVSDATEPRTAQATWDWLGVVDGRKEAGRRRRGIPLKCGRCRAEGRARMNGSDRCRSCLHEDWWDE